MASLAHGAISFMTLVTNMYSFMALVTWWLQQTTPSRKSYKVFIKKLLSDCISSQAIVLQKQTLDNISYVWFKKSGLVVLFNYIHNP